MNPLREITRDSGNASILVVDDEPFVTALVSRWLQAEGYRCACAGDGQEAVARLRREKFDLVVTDIMMPRMTGVQLLEKVQGDFPHTAVIVLTGVDDRKTAADALRLGAYGFVIKPFEKNELLINVANALMRRGLEQIRDRYEVQLEDMVQKRTAELRRAQEEITLRLTAASEFRDTETGAHVRRMGRYAEVLAARLGHPVEFAGLIRLAAPMHDVGKIGIPDSILLRPGKLSAKEFEVMKTHTTIGAALLEGSGFALLETSREIALHHHERWDGTGYPDGLAGMQIPESARIVAVLDVYDALVHNRVYRPAMPEPQALSIITEGSGTQFDARVLSAFLHALPDLRAIGAEVTDAQAPARALAASVPDDDWTTV